MRDLIGTRIELRLTEPMDSLIDRKLQEKLPAVPGRGLTPDGRVMQLAHTSGEDIAHLASFFISEGAGFISGQVVYAAGGPKA